MFIRIVCTAALTFPRLMALCWLKVLDNGFYELLFSIASSSTPWRHKDITFMKLETFYSVHKDFQIIPSFFSSLSLVLFSSTVVLEPMICQPHTGGSCATSHMRMKARKERTRWHQKICLLWSLVVKAAIWLPSGRLGERVQSSTAPLSGKNFAIQVTVTSCIHCSWKGVFT